MKDKIIKYGTMGSYLLLYVIVAIVSLISSIHFFDLAHAGWMSVVLACSFELGQMACLFGALTRKKSGFDIVWIMFVALTLFQCMANTYAAYIGLHDFQGWSELFGLNELELIDQKRIIAYISGAILPLVALGFIKCLVDYLKDEPDEEADSLYDEPDGEKEDDDLDDEKEDDPDDEKEDDEPKNDKEHEPKVYEGIEVSDEEAEKIKKDNSKNSSAADAKQSLELAVKKLQNMVDKK